MKKCPRCGAENPDDAQFCRYCYYPLNEGVVFRTQSVDVEALTRRVHLSKKSLLASLWLSLVYHVLLPGLFIAGVLSSLEQLPNGTVTSVLSAKYLFVLLGLTTVQLVASALGGFAFRERKRAWLYLLYPLGLMGVFYSMTVPPTDFFRFGAIYYPSGLGIIVGGSYFATLLREVLEGRFASAATLALLIYYFLTALIPGLLPLWSFINVFSTALLIYAVSQAKEG
ncbi:MAG: zinc ribbon domain-containing protein [Thermoprotei archaeon]